MRYTRNTVFEMACLVAECHPDATVLRIAARVADLLNIESPAERAAVLMLVEQWDTGTDGPEPWADAVFEETEGR